MEEEHMDLMHDWTEAVEDVYEQYQIGGEIRRLNQALIQVRADRAQDLKAFREANGVWGDG